MAPRDLNDPEDFSRHDGGPGHGGAGQGGAAFPQARTFDAPEPAEPEQATETREPTATTRPPRRRRVVMLVILAAIVAAGGWFGKEWWTVGRFAVTTDDAYVEADFAILSPKVAGYVAEVPVRETDRVAKGDPLVIVDDGDYRVRVRSADAAIAARKAALDRIDSQIVQAGAVIGGAEANVAAAEASLAQAEADRSRYEALAKSDFSSQQRLEAARAAAETARATLAARHAAVDEAKAALAVAKAGRAEATAALESAEADRAMAARDLDAATIRAPFDGVVGNLSVAAGDYVQPGARLLAVIPLAEVYIDANFKETDLAGLGAGAPVHVEVDAFPGRDFTGHVRGFAPATGAMFSLLPPENATGNFTKVVQRVPVRIDVPAEVAAAGWLRPGLSVVVSADSRDAGE